MITAPYVSRRSVLTGLGAGAFTLAAGRLAQAADCSATGYQLDGPFYPLALPTDQDVDLTTVVGNGAHAAGEIIEVKGLVRDAKCQPLANCVIEIWQADMHGRYGHPLEPQGDQADKNFQFYARLMTDKDGGYRFRTVKPGSYLAMGDWIRPPHIHFKVNAPFNPGLTTQMYFAGDPLNDLDLLQKALSADQRTALQVAFDTKNTDGLPTGTFNISLAEGWVPPPELMEQLKQGG